LKENGHHYNIWKKGKVECSDEINPSAKLEIYSSGNVGIGADPPAHKLHVSGNYAGSVIRVDNLHATPYGIFIKFGSASPDDQTQYFMRGADLTATEFTIWSDGSFAQASDKKLKKNIEVVEEPQLPKINQLVVKEYNKVTQKDGENKRTGLIAQDLELIYPELVSVVRDEETGEEQNKMINYVGLIMPLIKAVQELDKINTELNAKISAQQDTMDLLKDELCSKDKTYSWCREGLIVGK